MSDTYASSASQISILFLHTTPVTGHKRCREPKQRHTAIPSHSLSSTNTHLVTGAGNLGRGGGCFGGRFGPDAFLDLLSQRIGIGRSGKVSEIVETVVDDAQGLRGFWGLILWSRGEFGKKMGDE